MAVTGGTSEVSSGVGVGGNELRTGKSLRADDSRVSGYRFLPPLVTFTFR